MYTSFMLKEVLCMSLKIWLPLTGSLINQGLDNSSVTNNGVTVDDDGKIGKCYNFVNGYLNLPVETMTSFTECSLCFWVRINAWNASYETYFQAGKNNSAWGDYIFGVLRNGTSSKICFTIGNGSTASNASYLTSDWVVGQWMHVAFVYSANTCKIYLNGELDKEYSTTLIPNFSKITKITVGHSNGSSYQTNCKMNDLRIYDNALSSLEIKHISQGLVIHYPLNRGGFGCDNLIVGTGGSDYINVYASGATSNARLNITTTMNEGELFIKPTSATSAEKYFRFMTPKAGSLYGFTANTTYTFSAYIKGVSTSSGTVKYRSQWQISGGGWTGGNETVIISGDTPTDYYYFTQTETIPSGATAYYFSIQIYDSTDTTEVYLKNLKMENGAKATNWCPNSLDSNYTSIGLNETVEFDTSGVNNNGIIYGSLNFSSDTPKYCVSSFFNGTNNAIYVGNFQSIIDNASAFTINIWFKKDSIGSKSYETLFGGPSGFELDTRNNNSASLSLYVASTRGGTIYSSFNFGEWYMVSMVSDRTNEYYYINGELVKTITAKTMPSGNYYVGAWQTESKQNYYGLLSDFRIYSTALSEAEILELYKTPVSIANNGALFTSGELMEG